MKWWVFALLSSVAAAATAVLAKVGVEGVPSNAATAVRTTVVLPLAWAVTVAAGEHRRIASMSRRSLVFLVLSGLATGASWLAYYRALQLAPASRVAPIGKLSLAWTIVLAIVFLGEPFSWRLATGAALIVTGALVALR